MHLAYGRHRREMTRGRSGSWRSRTQTIIAVRILSTRLAPKTVIGDGLHQILTSRVHPGDKQIRAAARDAAKQRRADRTATRSRQG
jgi:hypothetical protein